MHLAVAGFGVVVTGKEHTAGGGEDVSNCDALFVQLSVATSDIHDPQHTTALTVMEEVMNLVLRNFHGQNRTL